jgi:hypothetical protein
LDGAAKPLQIEVTELFAGLGWNGGKVTEVITAERFRKLYGETLYQLNLNSLKGTKTVYSAGLSAFRELRCGRRERKRVARNTLNGFWGWLEKRKYTPKTIRAYVRVPTPLPVSRKYPWTLEKVSEFIGLIKGLQDPLNWKKTC